MAAYIVFIRQGMRDEAEMEIYGKLAMKASEGHKITPMAFYGDLETLEGPEMDGLVILKFDDMEAARAWYHSPAYQEAKAHREKGADYNVLLVNGV